MVFFSDLLTDRLVVFFVIAPYQIKRGPGSKPVDEFGIAYGMRLGDSLVEPLLPVSDGMPCGSTQLIMIGLVKLKKGSSLEIHSGKILCLSAIKIARISTIQA